jgi:hypothetical protein
LSVQKVGPPARGDRRRGLYEEAENEARRQGISFEELCRRLLARALRHGEDAQPWMQFAGIIESRDPGASQSVDEVVHGRERP